MRLCVCLFLFCYTCLAFAKETSFQGNIGIGIYTNIPGFSFKAKTIKPTTVKAEEKEGKIQSLYLEIDPKNIDTGIKLRNRHMIKKVFKNKSITYKSQKIDCSSKEKCSLNGALSIGGVTKEVIVNVTNSKNQFTFEKKLSLKEMKIEELKFLKVRVKDIITITGSFKKNEN